MPKKERQPDWCPLCYSESGIDEPLVYQPGSSYSHFCNKGHSYEDRELLGELMRKQTAARLAGKIPGPPPKPPEVSTTESPIGDQTVISATKVDMSGITIDAINFVRLSDMLGHFTDASSLFGSVYALQQQLNDTREMLNRSEAAIKLSEVYKLGGDMEIKLIIPEDFIKPLEEIAEANGMDITRYMNSAVHEGFKSGWYW